MISAEEAFELWAPDGVFWSQWAKPVVFASATTLQTDPLPPLPVLDFPGLPRPWDSAAIVVDVPGAQAVATGLALAERGFRPVPLFNGTSGPAAVVPVEPIARGLGGGADMLRRLTIPQEAKPAFLLDAERNSQLGAAEPGRYDNRWIVLPQDFPSGRLLLENGIKEVILIRDSTPLPDQDLTHVLMRWRQDGIHLRAVTMRDGVSHDTLSLAMPARFRKLWYAAVAIIGLRRNNVGGFGDLVPEQTQRSGFYG